MTTRGGSGGTELSRGERRRRRTGQSVRDHRGRTRRRHQSELQERAVRPASDLRHRAGTRPDVHRLRGRGVDLRRGDGRGRRPGLRAGPPLRRQARGPGRHRHAQLSGVDHLVRRDPLDRRDLGVDERVVDRSGDGVRHQRRGTVGHDRRHRAHRTRRRARVSGPTSGSSACASTPWRRSRPNVEHWQRRRRARGRDARGRAAARTWTRRSSTPRARPASPRARSRRTAPSVRRSSPSPRRPPSRRARGPESRRRPAAVLHLDRAALSRHGVHPGHDVVLQLPPETRDDVPLGAGARAAAHRAPPGDELRGRADPVVGPHGVAALLATTTRRRWPRSAAAARRRHRR